MPRFQFEVLKQQGVVLGAVPQVTIRERLPRRLAAVEARHDADVRALFGYAGHHHITARGDTARGLQIHVTTCGYFQQAAAIDHDFAQAADDAAAFTTLDGIAHVAARIHRGDVGFVGVDDRERQVAYVATSEHPRRHGEIETRRVLGAAGFDGHVAGAGDHVGNPI